MKFGATKLSVNSLQVAGKWEVPALGTSGIAEMLMSREEASVQT